MEKSQTNYNSQEIINYESVNKDAVKAQILEVLSLSKNFDVKL